MDALTRQGSRPPGALDSPGSLRREPGPVGLATRVLRRATRAVVDVGSLTFFVRDLEAPPEPHPPSGFAVRQFRASDAPALLPGPEGRGAELQARFARGDLCFGAVDERGLAVHTRWVTLTGAFIPELERDFVPGPDAAYFYDGTTRPDARRLGIDAMVRAGIFAALRILGRVRVYSYVRDDNPGGLRAAARCQQVVGTIRATRILGGRPRLSGPDLPRLAPLLREPGAEAALTRARAWHRWFEGWLQEPLARRSIGFHALPEDAFRAMADHISSLLDLDPHDAVLDVGCDSALVSRFVAPRCARLVGVDFIPGMLVDGQRRGADLPSRLRFAAADGRHLPFPSATFTKAYCSGVIHTLPSREDGVALILELIRVCRPGGRILVAAVPDTRKRGEARREAWRQGDAGARARIVAAAVLPDGVKRLARRLAPGLPRDPLVYLEYDLARLKAEIEARGGAATILDYPGDFWSRDFERTRSNLLIAIPASARPAAGG